MNSENELSGVFWESVPKLKVKLNELEKTTINVSTKEDYQQLMKAYELAEWFMEGGFKGELKKPTKTKYWEINQENTCIDAFKQNSGFGYRSKKYEEHIRNLRVISDNDFYSIQGISQKDLCEINNYFQNLKEHLD